MSKYDDLGRARVLRDRRTGHLVVDEDSIQGQPGGDEPDLGYEDEDFEGDWGDTEVSSSPEVGRRRKRKGKGRGNRRWGMTAVGGAENYEAAGPATVRIRLQHDFKAQDITFTGSVDGATVTSIFFGDQAIWSTPEGIDVSVFGSTSLLRELLQGQRIEKGLDITVNGTVPGEGKYSVTLMGQKPSK